MALPETVPCGGGSEYEGEVAFVTTTVPGEVSGVKTAVTGVVTILSQLMSEPKTGF